MSRDAREIDAAAGDGHRYKLIARIPAAPRRSVLWLPALGIAARHYLPLADALCARGVAVFVHEWRGHGSSSLRAGPDQDWGYRELLLQDVPASERLVGVHAPQLPRVIGGHSLGGQLACCRVALQANAADALWLVGSGAPYWRAFPLRQRAWLPLAYRFLPWLARRCGYLPGRRIGFGGNEARGLIADWAATAISGRYAAKGIAADLDGRLAGIRQPVRAAVLSGDWMAPESSTRFLLSRLAHADAHLARFDAARLGTTPDHYAWMKQPDALVAWLDGDG